VRVACVKNIYAELINFSFTLSEQPNLSGFLHHSGTEEKKLITESSVLVALATGRARCWNRTVICFLHNSRTSLVRKIVEQLWEGGRGGGGIMSTYKNDVRLHQRGTPN
jgi:hypothetical protein